MSPASVPLGEDGPSLSIDREGLVCGWDDAFDALWGRSAEFALGRRLAELLVALEPKRLPRFEEVQSAGVWSGVAALLPTNGNAPRATGVRLRQKAGADALELSLTPLCGLVEPGAAGAAPADAARDLQRFAALLELMPGFCYTVDRDLVFTSSAGKGLEALNLRPGQVIGANLRDMWGTHEDTYEPFVCHLEALAGIPANYKDVCLGRSLEYSIRPLYAADGSICGAIGVGLDVTELQHARQEQAKLTAQLMQAQKVEALGRLSGGIAHDFNNFLTCIMGNLALLERFVAGEPEAQTLLAQANCAVDSAASLTRQLLAFSRKRVISPRPTSLSAVVGRLGKILMRVLGDRVNLQVNCDPELWSVNADPGQLEQIIINLVMNARDAIAERGHVLIETRNVDLEASGAVPPLGPGQYVELSVTDTGRGMSDVVRARLFEPFFTTKNAGEGTGLGLATVYRAVQQNGGAITVSSELGQGSTFRVLLPRIEAPAMSVEETPASGLRHVAKVAGGTETILLVEDEPLVLELAQRTLQQLGYNVLPCGGSDEALRIFGEYQRRIELLITDVVMPRLNGNELAGRIGALSPGVAVLFTSGHGDSWRQSCAARPGGTEEGLNFLAKPYHPRQLALTVRALLDRRRQLG